MGTFGKSFSRELGKNTGKYVSNKVFGNSGWATPRRHIIDIEEKKKASEERKQEREEKRAEREAERESRRVEAEERRRQREIEKQEYQEGVELRKLQREIARQEKQEEREHKAWIKEQARIDKEEEIQSNFDEYENFENYLESIQSVHEVSIEKIDWNSLIEPKLFKDFLESEYAVMKLLEEFEVSDDYKLAELILEELKYATIDEDLKELIELAEVCDNGDSRNLILRRLKNYKKYSHDLDLDFMLVLLSRETFYAALYGELENGKFAAEQNIIPEKRPNYLLEDRIISLTKKMDEYIENKKQLSQTYLRQKYDHYTKLYDEHLKTFESIKNKLEKNISDLNKSDKKLDQWQSKLSNLLNKNKIIALISNTQKKITEAEKNIKDLTKTIATLEKSISNTKKKLEELEPELPKLKKIKDSGLLIQKDIKELEDTIDGLQSQINQLPRLSELFDKLWYGAYSKYIEHRTDLKVLQNIVEKNPDYYSEASKLRPFQDFLTEFGATSNFNYYSDLIDNELYINIEGVVPKEKTTVTSRGVLSKKPFTTAERNEIVKNYVSSISLRLALEMFAVFPVSELIISVIYNERSSKTGHFEDVILLSVNIERKILDTLNLDYVNPSEALSNFKTNIKYSKNKGLQSVERITVPSSKRVKFKKTEKKAPEKNMDRNDSVLTIKPTDLVSKLKKIVKETFNVDIDVKTKAGNTAGDNRKLKALSKKEFKKITVQSVKDIVDKIGVNIEITNTKNTKAKKPPQNNDDDFKIEINKTMKVKDVTIQFEKFFNKKVTILSAKGNVVSDNRRIQALTSKKIDQEFFVLDKLTKANLKKIKQRIGLHIDY